MAAAAEQSRSRRNTSSDESDRVDTQSKRKRPLLETEELETNVELPEPQSKKAKQKEKRPQSSSRRNTSSDESDHVDTEKKRKRSLLQIEELEIDPDLPEPQSKKAKRKEKRALAKDVDKHITPRETTESPKVRVDTSGDPDAPATKSTKAPKRGEHGIWMGNLEYRVTKEDLRKFLEGAGSIDGKDITRVFLPAPNKKGSANQKDKNKGFAYVDFSSAQVQKQALALNEKLVQGRKVLIKKAEDFQGRPEKNAESTDNADASSNGPCCKVFVGDLDFAITPDDLFEHFSQAGEVADVFMGTFPDSGICKGWAFVWFYDIEAAKSAVRGFLYESVDEAHHDDDDGNGSAAKHQSDQAAGEKKHKSKQKKRWINRINGRWRRCEFAQSDKTRWEKRFGKEKGDAKTTPKKGSAQSQNLAAEDTNTTVTGAGPDVRNTVDSDTTNHETAETRPEQKHERGKKRKSEEGHEKRKKPATNFPVYAPKATGAIAVPAGKKTNFD